jgi:hypothetical protein
MAPDDENYKPARMPEAEELPTRGGLYWFMGSVSTTDIPEPCTWCVHFLAQLTDEELNRLI